MTIQFKLLKNSATKPSYSIKNESEQATIYLYQPIGGFFGLSAEDFVKDLQSLGEVKQINLRINSPGGDVFDAKSMAQLLRDHPAKVTAYIDGVAASAATTVANGADEVVMGEGAMYMIHNGWTVGMGDYREFEKIAQMLKKVNDTIALDYQRKSGKQLEQINQWMDEETWFDADEAVENGFADRVTPSDKSSNKNMWDLSGYSKTPDALMKEPEGHEEHQNDIESMRRHLRMLELT